MYRLDTILTDLVVIAKQRKLSKRKIARLTGLHPNTLLDFGRPYWAPSLTTIRRLEHILFELPDKGAAGQPPKHHI